MRQDKADHGAREERLSSDEREKLKRLRVETPELPRRNEILKGTVLRSDIWSGRSATNRCSSVDHW